MSIGLSHRAQLLLVQLVQAYHRGEREGLSGEELAFTLSVQPDRTTVLFAGDHPSLETSDPNAFLVLRANGLIEDFTSIVRTSNAPRYIVTQAGMNVAGRAVSFDDPEADVRADESGDGDASEGRVEELVTNKGDTSRG